MNTDRPSLIDSLSDQEFKSLLTLVVECEQSVVGKPKTKTSIELENYLKVLDAKMTLAEFVEKHPHPFEWKQLRILNLSAIVACCYIRAFTEAGFYRGAKNA